MNAKELLLVLMIIFTVSASLTAVSAGWFDFLGNDDAPKESLFDQYDFAYANINVSDENNRVYVIDLVQPEYTFHVQNDLGYRDLSDEGIGEANIVTGHTTNTNSSCTLGIETSVNISNATFYRLDNKSGRSLLGTQYEKDLSGNLTDIFNKSLKNESNMTLSGFGISFTPHNVYNRDTNESFTRYSNLNPDDIVVNGDRMTFKGQINDTSKAYDLTKLDNVTATIYMGIGEAKNPIRLEINIPITYS